MKDEQLNDTLWILRLYEMFLDLKHKFEICMCHYLGVAFVLCYRIFEINHYCFYEVIIFS